MKWPSLFPLLLLMPTFLGCGHEEKTAKVPPPPELPKSSDTRSPSTVPEPATAGAGAIPLHVPATNPRIANNEPAPLAAGAKPIYTEIGLASWYGPPYHNRRSANGEIYDMNQMTAAHRTLPLNSIVRVTNMKTGGSAIVRVTDRGPFIGERMLDLSLAAAKALDVWEPGTSWVKMDVLTTPVPLDSGGKWEVQIGAFDSVQAAMALKDEIVHRYHPARVVEFTGPTGEWVRVRVQDDRRELAEEISRNLISPQGGVFLVRLD